MNIELEKVVDVLKGDVKVLQNLSASDFDTDFDDLGVDSLDRSSMFLDLEESFEVEFSDDDVDELNTVNKVYEFLTSAKK